MFHPFENAHYSVDPYNDVWLQSALDLLQMFKKM